MADTRSITALNIGSQTISAAKFMLNKQGGLTVLNYDSTQILADPSAEATRLPQIRLAISELAEKMNLSKEDLRYAISGQSVFVRFIKLPPVGGDDIDQLIRFEAQQQVPFPIEEVTWDYHLLPDSGGEQEVALVAIKTDALNEIDEIVEDAGLSSSSGVSVAPLALYNAYVDSNPDTSGSTVLVDIGARTMSLIYIEGSKVFVRSIPGGGSTLTTAIAKEFGISFAEAEAQKTQNGMVALGGGHTQSLDEGTAALATVLRNALNRIVSEIPRTTGFFRSQHGGSAPTKVVLCGGTASLPYCKEFIEEKLRLPVEFFNPLGKISVAKGFDSSVLASRPHMVGELVGVALGAFKLGKVDIELVPEAIEKERESKRKLPLVAAGSTLAVLGAGIFAFGAVSGAKKVEQEKAALDTRLSELNTHATQQQSLYQSAIKLAKINKQYGQAQLERVQWVDLLGDIVARVKSDQLWIVDFDPLVGHDVTKEEGGEGASFYVSKLGTLRYGESALSPELPKVEPEKPRRGGLLGPPQPKTPENPQINAIRLSGLFLTSAGPNTVHSLVKSLSGSPYFEVKDAKGERLDQNKIITKLDPQVDPEEFAAPFTIILPLKTPIKVPSGK